MIRHNGKIFFCTAQIQMCVWAVLEIKNYFLISYNEKRFLKLHPITTFSFQSLKIKVTLVMVYFENL